jgi:hypothetical protein
MFGRLSDASRRASRSKGPAPASVARSGARSHRDLASEASVLRRPDDPHPALTDLSIRRWCASERFGSSGKSGAPGPAER